MCLDPFGEESGSEEIISSFLYLPRCGHKFHDDCKSKLIEA